MKRLLVLFLVLFLCTPAVAGNMTDNIDFAGHVRFRGYDMQNMWSFNDDADFDNWKTYRLRSSFQFKATPSENISGMLKLTNQTYGNGVVDRIGVDGDNLGNKVFVDNAFITVADFFGTGATLNAGRMNLMYGSGFVLFDGNSQFASTSLYFDGLKVSFPLGDYAVLDALYFKDEENNRSEAAKDDITMGGAYLTAQCPFMGGKQELYVLNRDDENISKDIWVSGIRLSDTIGLSEDQFALDYSGEFAYQFGQFNDAADVDQDAMGYKLDLGFSLKDVPFAPRLFCGYVFLEGDDPDTDDKERWDVFYGGWPQFGDMLAWKYVNIGPGNAITDYDANYNEGSSVGGEAVFSNISIASVGIGAMLSQNLNAKFTYGLLTADETDAGKDDDIGDYYQLQASYAYSKNLSFSLYTAMIDPGDAHAGDDEAYEIFWETMLKF